MRNLHQEVTARIVAQLKAGTVPWKQPWSGKASGGMPRNAITGRAYSGANVVMCWITAQERGYSSPGWLTFQQAKMHGASVRKGEKGTGVFYVSFLEKEQDGRPYRVPFLKAFTVFNVAQVDGLPDSVTGQTKAPAANPQARCELADAFIASTGANISHCEARAYYRSATDCINLPPFETFKSADAYYGRAFHELTHWSGAKPRLDRDMGKRFGDATYAAEELVAELGSAFLCAEFGFDNDGQDAAYIATWIKFLEDHERAFIAAASAAGRAADYMRGLALSDETIGEELAIAA